MAVNEAVRNFLRIFGQDVVGHRVAQFLVGEAHRVMPEQYPAGKIHRAEVSAEQQYALALCCAASGVPGPLYLPCRQRICRVPEARPRFNKAQPEAISQNRGELLRSLGISSGKHSARLVLTICDGTG